MKNIKASQVPVADDELKRRLYELEAENDRLNREISELKNELREYKGKSKKIRHNDKFQSSLLHRANTEYMFSKKSFASFLFAQLKCTSFFNVYRRVINAFRKYSFVTTTLKVFSILFLLVEASILVLVSTSAFIASIVFTLLVSHAVGFFTILARKKCNKQNASRLAQKNVTVFFPPKDRSFDADSFFRGFVLETALKPDSTVVVVSPYIFNSKGLTYPKKAYALCRDDGTNVILVRRRYYFTLRKKIIDKVCATVTEIY